MAITDWRTGGPAVGVDGRTAANSANIPPGSTLVQTNGTLDVYKDAAGNVYVIDRATGETPRGELFAQPNTTLDHKGLKEIADDTNVIGSPGFGGDDTDLSKTPEFAMLKGAADKFLSGYDAERAAATESRGMDLDTIARLRAAEEGKTPSAAEALMRKAIDQNASQALGLAATVGGANPGMALRAGLEAQQSAGSRSAADIAALRAKEMEAARALLAQQTSNRTAQDITGRSATGSTAAGLAAAPYQAITQEKAAEDARNASYLQTGGQIVSAYVSKPEDKQATSSDIRGKTDVQPSPEMADTFLRQQSGGAISPSEMAQFSRGQAPTANDPRSIENPSMRAQTGGAVSPAEADAFLSTLRPQSFKYKNPDGVNKQPGTRLGVMAQDLPDHDVVTDPSGKKWISADVISDVLAGMGRLNEKVDAKTGASGRGGRARQQTGGAISEEERRRMAARQSPQPSQEVMIPQSAVHDYLAGLGIVPP